MTMKIKSLLIINTKEMKSLCVNNVLSFKEFKPLQKGLFSFTSMKKNATLTGPLLISGNKFSTFTFKSSCANIVKRFMMSSSGGRNPKLPASPPSEKKTPSSMYSQKDLENGAEGCKVPLLDLYTPSTTPYSFKQPSGSASIPTVASANSNSQINATKTSADNALKNVRDHLPQIPSVPASVIEQKVQPSSPIKSKVSFGLGHAAYINRTSTQRSGAPQKSLTEPAPQINAQDDNPLENPDFLVTGPTPPTPPPPLPSHPIIKSVIHSFVEELEEKVQDRKNRAAEIKEKFKALEEKNLYDPERNLLKADFYTHLEKKISKDKVIPIEVALTETQITIGLLAINDTNNTIFLGGKHTHVMVIYTIINGHKIVGGYLTSQKNTDHILLSETQPFPRDDGKPSQIPQYFKPIKPFIVNDNDIEALPEETQQLGKAYIQQDEIQHKLHNAFNKKIALLANTITVYNGQGITLEDIDFVLQESNKAAQLWAENHFQRYKIKLQISETNAKEWLKKMESNNKAAYPYLKKLIDEKYNT